MYRCGRPGANSFGVGKRVVAHVESIHTRPSRLPQLWTRLIGRDTEIAQLRQLLMHTRLLSITGPGGAGKTLLALHLAEAVKDSYDAVYLCELEAIADGSQVAGAVAACVGVEEKSGRSVVSALADELRETRALLILDNCEHVLDACANVCATLLRYTQALTIVATSRERLALTGEVTWPIPSLTVPTPDDELAGGRWQEFAAVRLFVERAQALQPSFTVDDATAQTVARICRELDGMPLAVILAATRVQTLTVGEIAERLQDRFELLRERTRGTLPRQQTLRALIDWSHELLQEPERVAWRRLSVCVGGVTLADAEALVRDSEVGAADSGGVVGTQAGSLDIVTSLVEKSILSRTLERDPTEGESLPTRYRMNETMRAYGLERLRAVGEEKVLRDRHARHYAQSCRERMRYNLDQPWPDSSSAHRWGRVEDGNLQAAFAWSVQSERRTDAQAILAFHLAYMHMPRALEMQWGKQVEQLQQREPDRLEDVIVAIQGWRSVTEGRDGAALIVRCEAFGNARLTAFAYIRLAEERLNKGEADAAEDALQQAESLLADDCEEQLLVLNLRIKRCILGDSIDEVRPLVRSGFALARRHPRNGQAGAFLVVALWWAHEAQEHALCIEIGRLLFERYAQKRESLDLLHHLFAAAVVFSAGDHATGMREWLAAYVRVAREWSDDTYTSGVNDDTAVSNVMTGLDDYPPLVAVMLAGEMIAALGDGQMAARLLGAARRHVPVYSSAVAQRSYEHNVRTLTAALGADVFAGCFADGEALTLLQAGALAARTLRQHAQVDDSGAMAESRGSEAAIIQPVAGTDALAPASVTAVHSQVDGSAVAVIAAIDRLSLAECTVIGEYRRFDERARHELRDWQQRIARPLLHKCRAHENFLIWAAPGSGKSFFIQEIARAFGDAVCYRELNLARLGHAEWVAALQEVRASEAPLLCMLDEIDARADERWPYEEAFALLDANLGPEQRAVFVLVGSSGGGIRGMIENMLPRSKATDMLDRIPIDRRFSIPPTVAQDKIVIFASQVLDAANSRGLVIEEIEKLAVYYALTDPGLQSPRQLRDLAVAAAERLPDGEKRLRYDDLFYRGDRRSKEFWVVHAGAAEQLASTYMRIG